jgi:hypothetical protein
MGGILSDGRRNALIEQLRSSANVIIEAKAATHPGATGRLRKSMAALKAAWMSFPENFQDTEVPSAEEVIAIVERLDREAIENQRFEEGMRSAR